MYQYPSILYHLTTVRGLGQWRTQRFGECKGEQSPFRVSLGGDLWTSPQVPTAKPPRCTPVCPGGAGRSLSRRRRPRDGCRRAARQRPGGSHLGLVVTFSGAGGGWHGTPTGCTLRAQRRARRHAFLAHKPSVVCRAATLPEPLSRGPHRPRSTPTLPPRSRSTWLQSSGRASSVAAFSTTREPIHTPPTGPPQMATDTETDDASRPEGVAARGLGAGVWARALKPEQT